MVTFPMTEPEIEVIELPGETMTVECRDARSFFVLLEDGASCEFAFYDYPERSLTGITKMKVEGRIVVNGKECFEIAACDWEPNEGESPPSHWYLSLEGNQLHWVRFVWRKKDGVGRSEEIDATPLPTILFVGLKTEGHETYVCGDEKRGDFITRTEVTGVAEVRIGEKRFKCLREVWTNFERDGSPLKLAELFISEQGRTVLFRRYNGRGSHNYEQLRGNPELNFNGEVYRLWYDCIPDHAIE
jgi:hypothetical protein